MKKPIITEIENVETKRVLDAMNRAKMWLNIGAIVALGICIPFFVQFVKSSQNVGIYLTLGLFVLFYIGITLSIHATYSPMLDTAKLNDKIRHEEKVRFAERDKHDLEREIERLKHELELANERTKDLK